jgi:hypothetical protein
MPIGPDEVKGYLRENFGIDPQFPNPPWFGSNSYEFVDEDWFHGPWFDEFWHATKPRVKWYQTIYRPNVFDCNTHTGWARLGASMIGLTAQAVNREAGGKASLLVGSFCYYRGGIPDDEHAMAIGMFGPNRIGFKETINRTRGNWRPEERCTFYQFE